MNIPENLRYTKDHEWAKMDGDTAIIGVTEYAIEQLGDITLVEMPQIDEEIVAGDTIGTIESVKAVSDMYAPLTGTVDAINEDLEDAPEKVNEDCYGAGWMLKIKVAEESQFSQLMTASDYRDHLDSLDD